MTLKLNAAAAHDQMDKLLADVSGIASLRPALKAFAAEHDVPL
jgi:1-deoxy-D-xylulose 5-phosphate reductoisomerase